MMRKLFTLLFIFISITCFAKEKIKVACVGNSITYGYGLENRQRDSYPSQLQALLVDSYIVGNFGKSGATLLNKGHRPYVKQEEYAKALEFAGDIVVIHLGINDTDPRNWTENGNEFIRNYVELIESFKKVNPKCRIIISRLTPITYKHKRFQSGTRDWLYDIQSAIESVAQYTSAQLIDFHEPLFKYPYMFPDAIHPTIEGASILANVVYSAITGDFGGLQLPEVYDDNMVLQRNRNINICGTANSGEIVNVSIGNKTYSTKAGMNGKWWVTLQPLTSDKTYTLIISTSKKKYTFNNILAGEVWLCSGQSNMEFQLRRSLTWKEEIKSTKNSNIRLLNMKPRWKTDSKEWEISAMDSVNRLKYYNDLKWEQCDSLSASDFSAIAYYFGKVLQDSLNVPIGLICNAVGGSPTEAWIDRKTIENDLPNILNDWLKNDFIQGWVRERAAKNIALSKIKDQRHPYEPCYLYEAGIAPLINFPINGVIWYQGESNAQNTYTHTKLFKMLVNSWRDGWKNKRLPFYYVQLSSLNRPSWPLFRFSQMQLMKEIENVGMTVSSDYGDSLDVHPRQKRPIGERLARWALNRNYGFANVVPSGPIINSAECIDDAVYLTFCYGEGLHASNGKNITSFEIAEIDGMYEPAIAKVDGKYIKVYNKHIKNPRFVRYGWQPFTRANLVNKAGLPASTFKIEAQQQLVKSSNISKLHGFPSWNKKFAKGVSAQIAGTIGDRLLIAGGCNFPDIPAREGGKKVYYDDIYVAQLGNDSTLVWKKAGKLPYPVAYGFSASYNDAIINVGGMNGNGAMNKAFKIVMKGNRTAIENLPDMPFNLDNMTGAIHNSTLYVAGGNMNGTPSNILLSLDLENTSKGWKRLSDFPGEPRTQSVCAIQSDENGDYSLFLIGGFAASSKGNQPSLSVDGYAYSLSTKEWSKISSPIDRDGEEVSLGGGAAISLSDSLILCVGGVNKDIFIQALRKPAPDYMFHTPDWYKFNKKLLAYNTKSQQWKEVTLSDLTARAGAILVPFKGNLLYINGELMPGIRSNVITTIKLNKAFR